MSSMMNPFKMRASEKIESDVNFISLYSPEILNKIFEISHEIPLWFNTSFFISSPGGGKTSLLRLFSPSILQHVFNRKDTEYKEIYSILNNMDVLTEFGCKRFGIYYLCSRGFSLLEDSDIFNPAQSKRYFFALLNARIILTTLQSILSNYDADYNALDQIRFAPNYIPKDINQLNIPCSGRELFEWAEKIESEICEMLDSFDPQDYKINGHDTIFAFKFLNANSFTYKGEKICEDFIFQLDDFHKLTNKQREYFKHEIIESRNNATVWVAERLEGFTINELLYDNNIKRRDYNYIQIENLVETRSSAQKKFYTTIADKRARLSTEQIDSFKEYLEEEYIFENGDNFEIAYTDLLDTIGSNELYSSYSNWIEIISKLESIKTKSIYLRAIKLHIEREEKKRYLFQLDKTKEEFDNFMKPDIIKICDSFLRAEYNIPLYFNFDTLIQLSSNNVEQFIGLAGDLFDNILLNKIKKPSNIKLSCQDQHEIILRFASQKYNDILNLPNGRYVKNLLDKLIRFAKENTFDDGSSYRTVTGFAVLEEHKKDLFENNKSWYNIDKYKILAETIKTCIAYNVFESRVITQGEKNQKWSVFYFNRWVCVFANIPLNYGGWRKISLNELNKNLIK